MKTYNPQSCITGTSGFSNFMGASAEALAKTREVIFNDFTNSVIIDGNDDWHAQSSDMPYVWIRLNAPITIMAYYHSGISGMTKSGIVISMKDYYKLVSWYQEFFKQSLLTNTKIKIYTHDTL